MFFSWTWSLLKLKDLADALSHIDLAILYYPSFLDTSIGSIQWTFLIYINITLF